MAAAQWQAPPQQQGDYYELVWLDAGYPRTIFSMFLEHMYREEDWYLEMTDDPSETPAVTEFYNLLHDSHLVAYYGCFGDIGGNCTYVFEDTQGCIHLVYDDDAGVLYLAAFGDRAAAIASFEQYRNCADRKEREWVGALPNPPLEISSMYTDDIVEAMGRR